MISTIKNIKVGHVTQSAWADSIKYIGSEDLKLDSRVKIIQKPQAFKGHKFFAFLTVSIAAHFKKGFHRRVAEGYVAFIMTQNRLYL